jgi:predicted MFS family arabinose efflux permease
MATKTEVKTMKPTVKHWQDPVNAIVGVGLILAPWSLGFQAERAAMANSVVVGLGLLAFALAAMFLPRAWEASSELVLGLWLIASPWVLQFNAISLARNAAIATGIVITALAVWVLLANKDYRAWWRKRLMHQ